MPGYRKRGPIRVSDPMPCRTWSTSAPTESQMVATALMKLIFIARKAFEAYLISSADFALVIRIGGGGVKHDGAGTAAVGKGG